MNSTSPLSRLPTGARHPVSRKPATHSRESDDGCLLDIPRTPKPASSQSRVLRAQSSNHSFPSSVTSRKTSRQYTIQHVWNAAPSPSLPAPGSLSWITLLLQSLLAVGSMLKGYKVPDAAFGYIDRRPTATSTTGGCPRIVFKVADSQIYESVLEDALQSLIRGKDRVMLCIIIKIYEQRKSLNPDRTKSEFVEEQHVDDAGQEAFSTTAVASLPPTDHIPNDNCMASQHGRSRPLPELHSRALPLGRPTFRLHRDVCIVFPMTGLILSGIDHAMYVIYPPSLRILPTLADMLKTCSTPPALTRSF